jgi:hypothetical protein
LTADRRLAPGKAGRDGGMVYSIKQRDGRITGVRPPNRQPEPTRISKEAKILHDIYLLLVALMNRHEFDGPGVG